MKPFFSYLLLPLFFIYSSCAQNQEKRYHKNTDSINVRIPEKPISRVSDFEGIFTAEESFYLDSVIAKHQEETTNEIAIVTYHLDSSQIRTPEEFNAYSLALFREWGVGEKDKNNGVGVLISENLRRIRIEVGYGLEAKLKDAEAKTIIDSIIIPEFKNGQYFSGISKGLEAIMREIK